MKSDKIGCSMCPPGREQYESFISPDGRALVQYDYRARNGLLFSTVAESLDEARRKKTEWLKSNT